MRINADDPGVEILQLALWNHRIERMLAGAAGLPVNEFHCVMLLFLCSPESARTLADLLGIRDSSLSKLLRKLELRQLVTRMPAASDRRIESVRLTETGVRAAEEALSHASVIAGKMLAEIAEDRRQQFRRCIKLLYTSNTFKEPEQDPVMNPIT